jgi:D-arabinose 1-dehydrogenase-like Zn-dependent alcohol dehydrogenase
MRITRAGVWYSDLHIWDGYFELGGGKRFYVKDRGCVPPFTPGHEGSRYVGNLQSWAAWLLNFETVSA